MRRQLPPLAEVDDRLLVAALVVVGVMMLWSAVMALAALNGRDGGHPGAGLAVWLVVWLGGWLWLDQPVDTMFMVGGVAAGLVFLTGGRGA